MQQQKVWSILIERNENIFIEDNTIASTCINISTQKNNTFLIVD